MSDNDWDDLCDNCIVKPKRPGGVECEACSKYRRRNGRARPLYLIERDLEKVSQGGVTQR